MPKTQEIIDAYAHDYRDTAMSEDALAVMLHQFLDEVRIETENALGI